MINFNVDTDTCLLLYFLHSEAKTDLESFCNNFVKCAPIVIIRSLLETINMSECSVALCPPPHLSYLAQYLVKLAIFKSLVIRYQ